MYLYFKCMWTSNVFGLQMYLYFKCMCTSDVCGLQMYVYLTCICTSNVFVPQMYLYLKWKSERVSRGHAQSRDSIFWILESGVWILDLGICVCSLGLGICVCSLGLYFKCICTSNVFVLQMYESREGTHRVGILDSGFWSLESGVWSLESGFWSLESGVWILERRLGWRFPAGYANWYLKIGLEPRKGVGWTCHPTR